MKKPNIEKPKEEKPKRGWSKVYEDYKPLSPALVFYAKKLGLI